MGFELTIVGCDGSYAGPGGACSGYLVSSPDAAVWLDAGPGTLGRLQLHCRLSELDAIVLSHSHPDHWLELPIVANALGWYEKRPPVPVYAPQELIDLARQLTEPDVVDRVFTWHPVSSESEVVIGDQHWRFLATDHYVETLASCVEVGGHRFVYTADTGPGWSIAAFGARPDVALCESTFLERSAHDGVLHLTPAEAGSMAVEAEVGHLVLTHLAPGEDASSHVAAAKEVFDGRITAAEMGATYSIG